MTMKQTALLRNPGVAGLRLRIADIASYRIGSENGHYTIEIKTKDGKYAVHTRTKIITNRVLVRDMDYTVDERNPGVDVTVRMMG